MAETFGFNLIDYIKECRPMCRGANWRPARKCSWYRQSRKRYRPARNAPTADDWETMAARVLPTKYWKSFPVPNAVLRIELECVSLIRHFERLRGRLYIWQYCGALESISGKAAWRDVCTLVKAWASTIEWKFREWYYIECFVVQYFVLRKYKGAKRKRSSRQLQSKLLRR